MDLMSFMEQMGTSNISVVAAFFIGLMMSISPCPLATNITAIAYTSRKIENSRYTLTVGMLYTLGRMSVYILLASLIVYVGANTQQVSFFLQRYGEGFIGSFLIIVGILILMANRFTFNFGNNKLNNFKLALAERGYVGGFILGIIFALAFCPFSAVLFFGMLMPLALTTHDGILLPSIFGFATGIPVIIASVLLVKGVSTVGRFVTGVRVVEKWMRKIVGVVFIAAGVYYVFTVNLGLF
ncbi:MAG: aromatic aminobenezylarsenical efflux permease ArsG family transporter [Archaeoglobaceae archaeon]